MQSNAMTVDEYLSSLSPDRRAAIQAVREVILANLDEDYEECMLYGMIGYAVPHRVYPAGYHCDPKQPLTFAALASQKNYMSVYLMSIYGDVGQLKSFREDWAKTGKKLNMGKSCIRFEKLEDLALDVIGAAVKRVPAKAYIERYEEIRRAVGRKPAREAKAAPAGASPGKTIGKAPKTGKS